MSNIFRIPVDNQHFKDTIEAGKTIKDIEKFLSDKEKILLKNISTKDGIIRYWGSIPGESNIRNFNKLKESDEVICYRSGKYIALAQVAFKTQNEKLAKYSWGTTETNKTWELIYFFKNVEFFEIDSSIINDEFGYEDGPVMGFGPIRKDRQISFIKKYNSLHNFIRQQEIYKIDKDITGEIEKINKIKSPFEAQYYLVDLGNQLRFNTYVPPSDAGHKVFNKKLDELITIRKNDLKELIVPKVFEPLSNIDVVWFNDHSRPKYFYEVIYKTGMTRAFARLKTVSDYYELAKTKIIGDKKGQENFSKSKRLYFPNSEKISYKYFDELVEVYCEAKNFENIIEKFLK